MKITYYGHSCFGIELNGKHLLFDPYISRNPLAEHIDIRNIKADYILISHGHNDHVADVEMIAKNTNAQLIGCYEVCEWFSEKKGIKNTHAMNCGGSWTFDFGKVKCVTAVHSSSMPDGSYGGHAMGFMVETDQGNFYYSGDTSLTYDMRLIGEYKKIHFAFLPIGGNFTMNADNAIIASEFINCDKVIGMHYNTFKTIEINKKDTIDKFERAGVELRLMEIGETLSA